MHSNTHFKPSYFLAAFGLLASVSAFSQQVVYGNVLSVTPHMAQVQVPQDVCVDQPVAPKPSGIGAAVGAILGGLIGNTAGSGNGKTAMTVASAVLGGLVGNAAEKSGGDQTTPAPTQKVCTTQFHPEVVQQGFEVNYDFLGVQHTTVLSQAPTGEQIALIATLSPAPESSPLMETPDMGAPVPVGAVPVYPAPVFAPAVETVLVGLPPSDIIVEEGDTYYFVMVDGVRERRFWMAGDHREELLHRQEEMRQMRHEQIRAASAKAASGAQGVPVVHPATAAKPVPAAKKQVQDDKKKKG